MRSHAVAVVVALAVTGAAGTGHAQETVSPGYDLFETEPGETDLLGIDLRGKPLNPPTFGFVPPPPSASGTFAIGDTDTIVHRLESASGNPGETDTIEIELVALSLVSTAPVTGLHPTLPDQHVSVTLQKDRDPGGEQRLDLDFDPPDQTNVFPGPQSLGQMSITFGSSGGTFDSTFAVFADVRLEDGTIVCGGALLPACGTFDGGLTLDPEPSVWAREPLPGSVVIDGVNRFLAGPGDSSQDFWERVSAAVPALGPAASLVLVLILPLIAAAAIRRLGRRIRST
jgi:hypothetical protein